MPNAPTTLTLSQVLLALSGLSRDPRQRIKTVLLCSNAVFVPNGETEAMRVIYAALQEDDESKALVRDIAEAEQEHAERLRDLEAENRRLAGLLDRIAAAYDGFLVVTNEDADAMEPLVCEWKALRGDFEPDEPRERP